MSKKALYLGSLVGVIGIVFGCFYDLKISQALFNINNKFSIFLAGYGESPALLASWLGFMILYPILKENNDKKLLRWLYALMIAPMYIFVETYIYYKEYLVVGLLLQIIICLLGALLIKKIVKDVDKNKLIKFGWLCVILPTSEILGCLIIKLAISRPRYRSVVRFDDLPFLNFWQVNYQYVKYFTTNKLLKIDEFFSFPSGHVANAACLLVLTLIPNLKSEDTNRVVYSLICYGFTLVVAFSRIVMGAHFLSDVSAGFLVCLYLFFGIIKWLNERETKMKIL